MKIVIAPDSFKESLAAPDVGAAIGAGVLEVCPKATIDICPMADGGEGTVEAVVAATGGTFLTADVFDPLGAPLRARFGMLGGVKGALLPGELGLRGAQADAQGESATAGRIAVIETAAASGLSLVPPERRDPTHTTTFGTGRLILAAMDAGAREIIVGLGGSATVDGGAGCLQALGVKFFDENGPIARGMGGGNLGQIVDFDASGLDERLKSVRIRLACDVTNPLTGPKGAAAVFGPQKGATPEMVELLDKGLAHFARLVRAKLGVEIETMPGAGAAGGIGAGLVAFTGAEFVSGLDMIANAVDLPARLAGADLCITGEGRLDASSAMGKTACGVARLARQAGVPVLCIPGQISQDAPRELFAAVYPLVDGKISARNAMANPQELLKIRTVQAVANFIAATN